jgi:ATP-dependent Lon protease
MAMAETTSPVLHFDEIDKVDRACAMALLDFFDDSGSFHDLFLDTDIDISDAILVATANDLSAIDPVLLSRFTVIHIPGYTVNEKAVIAKDYLLPSIANGMNVSVSEEALSAVLERFACEAGVRGIKHGLHNLVKQSILEQRHSETVEIYAQDVERILGPKPHIYVADTEAGCVNSLAVAGDSLGMVSPIRVTLLESGNRRITGLAEESILDSIAVAETWLETLGYSLDKGFHIHFGPAGIKKNGPSAGVAIMMAFLSALTGRSLGNVAFSGECDGYNVLPVGGVQLKVQAAQAAGLKTVYLPEANRCDIDVGKFDVEIVFVKSVNEVIAKLIPEIETFPEVTMKAGKKGLLETHKRVG